jgi:predicted glycoside hydrolase/deacetylase ChbG (UPF0249 family)
MKSGKSNPKRLIINCDDFGQSAAANQAIMHLLEEGKVSSATIMAPAPGFEEAAAWTARRNQPNVGLHLTLTSEYEALRWSSLTGDPSLHDDQGYQFRTVKQFELEADTKAVVKEIQAQYDRAVGAGINISHVDNHMGSLYGRETGRSLLPQALWKSSRWGLPTRFFRYIDPSDSLLSTLSDIERPVARASALADVLGVQIPDYLLSHPYHIVDGETYDSFKQSMIANLYKLPDGVSETYIHPGVPDEWMKVHIPNWEKRVWEYQLMLDDDYSHAMRDSGVILTDYRYVQTQLRRSKVGAAFRLMRLLTQ